MMSSCLLTALCITLVTLTSCGWKDTTTYRGNEYAPTPSVQTTFQYTQVPDQCMVFAELLVTLPPHMTGKTIAELIMEEARNRGADVLLIGQTRRHTSGDEQNFIYLGPTREYNCKQDWTGWKSAFSWWEDQGQWVDIGYTEWGKESIRFADPLIMQAALLRCK